LYCCSHEDNVAKIKIKGHKLKPCFELSCYLDDSHFFSLLVECLIRSWPSNAYIIEQLNENLQRDIYLHLPFTFIANKYRRDGTFMNLWMNKNGNDESKLR